MPKTFIKSKLKRKELRLKIKIIPKSEGKVMSEYTKNIEVNQDQYNQITLVNENSTVIAELFTSDCHDVKMSEIYANAQLFKTAPELLEALEVAKKAMTNQRYNKPKRDMEEEYKIVEKAIKKAKGELNANNN